MLLEPYLDHFCTNVNYFSRVVVAANSGRKLREDLGAVFFFLVCFFFCFDGVFQYDGIVC